MLHHKAKSLFNQQKYNESLALINKALDLHVTKDKLHLKANVYIQLMMPEQAVATYKQILMKDGNDIAANEFVNQFIGRVVRT